MSNVDRIQNVPLKQYLYYKAARKGIPLSVTFELSPLCNFNCTMCFIHQSAEQVKMHPRKMVTLDEWMHIARTLKELGTLYILLTGGEPLLWPDFWKLYPELIRMGFLVSINTNGSLLNEETIARFAEMPPNQINITLYGASDDSYCELCGVDHMYSRIENGIDGLIRAGVIVRLNCSVTPHNAKDLDKILKFADERKLPVLSSTYMYPPVRRSPDMIGKNDRFSPEQAAFYRMKIVKHQFSGTAYRKVLKSIIHEGSLPLGIGTECTDPETGNHRCYAGRASCWITWDGYMGLCGMISHYYEDLKTNSVKDSWNKIKKNCQSIPTCGTCLKCDFKMLCHSCMAMCYAENGRTDQVPAYLCRMVREMQHIAEDELQNM